MAVWCATFSCLFSSILLSLTHPVDGGNVDVVYCADGTSNIVGTVSGIFQMPDNPDDVVGSFFLTAELGVYGETDRNDAYYIADSTGARNAVLDLSTTGTIIPGRHTSDGAANSIAASGTIGNAFLRVDPNSGLDGFDGLAVGNGTTPEAGDDVNLMGTSVATGNYEDEFQDAISIITVNTMPDANTIRWITCAAAYDSVSGSCVNPETNCPTLFAASVVGDPHITRWHKDSFDFHGECDLVMVHSDKTINGKPLDLHIRTTIEGSFSSITAMALRVGDDIVEIDPHRYSHYKLKRRWGNGLKRRWDALPFQTDSFYMTEAIKHPGGPFRRSFEIIIGDGDHKSTIHVRRSRANRSIDLLSISIDGSPLHFGESHGLLGNYVTGDALGRDGRKMDGDWNAYGMEWQVTANEPKLFREDREPQLPHAKCIMPSHEITSEMVHALKVEFPDLFFEAQVACRMAGHALNDCMEDVMLAKDVKAAGAYI